jgi:hypothetical protein
MLLARREEEPRSGMRRQWRIQLERTKTKAQRRQHRRAEVVGGRTRRATASFEQQVRCFGTGGVDDAGCIDHHHPAICSSGNSRISDTAR